MGLSRKTVERIRDLLQQHPHGLSITNLAKIAGINRNTAGRYLDQLLLSGQVEMHHFGMAKLFRLSERLPVSAVLSISSEFVLQLDSSLRVIFINDPFLEFAGTTAKDIVGKNIEFTGIPSLFGDDGSVLLVRFRAGVTGTEWWGEVSLPEQRTIFFCRIVPTVFNEGTKGVSVLFEDITSRKRDEEHIRQSEARLRSIIRVSPIGIGVVQDRVFLEVNARFCQITGYTSDELIGQSARMLYRTQEEYDRVGLMKYAMIRDRGTGSVETHWLRKDGVVIDVLLRSTPLDTSDASKGITFTALDITARKRAEVALRESEAKLQLALSGSEMGMWELDMQSSTGSIDERAAAILGYRKSDIGSFRAEWDALSHPDDVPLIRQRLADYLEGRSSIFESEHRMRHTSGRWIWVLGRGKSAGGLSDGSWKKISGTMQDITERKNAEQELRESEDRYRNLVEISPDAVFLHRNGTIIYVNPAATSMLGARHPEEIIGKNVFEFIRPDYREPVMENIKKDLAGEKTPPIELQMHQLDGTPFIVEGRGVKTYFDGKPAVQVSMRDITERKKREIALKSSEERYRRLVEQSFDAVVIHKGGKIIVANEATAAIAGASSPEDLIGRSIYDFVHPVSQQFVKDRLADLGTKELMTFPLVRETFRRIDGKPVDVEVMSTWFMDNGIPAVQVVFRIVKGA
jgi:PAS domain S-box-containing protein